jgi:hypothetical protein
MNSATVTESYIELAVELFLVESQFGKIKIKL